MRCCVSAVDFDKEIVRVYKMLMSISERCYYPHDTELAHDLASDTVVKALEARDRFDDKRPMLPWCRTIMRNLFLTSVIRGRRCVPLGDHDAEGGTEADQRVMMRQELTAIGRMMRSSVSVKTLVEFAKGYSVHEISVRHGVPPGTVMRRVHDARRMVRVMLG